MQLYQQAGLGGLEITPIYGVKGAEDKFIDFLSSPMWLLEAPQTNWLASPALWNEFVEDSFVR